MANLKPFRRGPDPRRNVTGRNGKAALALARDQRLAALVELVQAPELAEQTRDELLETLARTFIDDGLRGDPVTVRRLFEIAFRYDW